MERLNFRCIACGSSNNKKVPFMNIKSRYNSISYPLFKCNFCGLIRPSQRDIRELLKVEIYNNPENIKFYDSKKEKIDETTSEYKDYFKHFKIYKNLAQKYGIHGKGLDVGCGAGHLINVMKEAGINMEGYEVTPLLVKALKKHKLKIHFGRLENIPRKKYDIITFNQVLEHVEFPNIFFKEMRNLLKSGGYIIFAVPYLKGLIPQVLRSYWYGLGYGQHLNFFSKESLSLLLEKSGFELCEFRVLLCEYTHKDFPRILNAFIRLIMFIILKLKLGDNLLVVARKK